jgi:hypothetical protein
MSTTIATGPHYEISSATLAEWVESRGPEQWWLVDGDRYLTSRIAFPCRSDELAHVLRRVNRTLLVTARDPQAQGQVVRADKLAEVADPLGSSLFQIDPTKPKPIWADDLSLWLCWKGEDDEWMLAENSRATRAFKDVIIDPIGAE